MKKNRQVLLDEKLIVPTLAFEHNMTEKERKDTKMATLYELRLLFTQGDKEQYTKEEIVELLDKIATAKEQE